LEDNGVHGKITLKWISKKNNGGVDWIGVAHGRNK
jgi:hypothetical protein